jgi:hypothetical protein
MGHIKSPNFDDLCAKLRGQRILTLYKFVKSFRCFIVFADRLLAVQHMGNVDGLGNNAIWFGHAELNDKNRAALAESLQKRFIVIDTVATSSLRGRTVVSVEFHEGNYMYMLLDGGDQLIVDSDGIKVSGITPEGSLN